MENSQPFPSDQSEFTAQDTEPGNDSFDTLPAPIVDPKKTIPEFLSSLFDKSPKKPEHQSFWSAFDGVFNRLAGIEEAANKSTPVELDSAELPRAADFRMPLINAVEGPRFNNQPSGLAGETVDHSPVQQEASVNSLNILATKQTKHLEPGASSVVAIAANQLQRISSRQPLGEDSELGQSQSFASQNTDSAKRLESLKQHSKQQAKQLRQRREQSGQTPKASSVDRLDLPLANVIPGAEAEPVLAAVERAADLNLPIERYYERSHEIKDEPTAFGDDGAPPAPILRSSLIDPSSVDESRSYPADSNNLISNNRVGSQQGSYAYPGYRKAIFKGIVAGIIMLVLCGAMMLIWNLVH